MRCTGKGVKAPLVGAVVHCWEQTERVLNGTGSSGCSSQSGTGLIRGQDPHPYFCVLLALMRTSRSIDSALGSSVWCFALSITCFLLFWFVYCCLAFYSCAL